MAAPPDGSTRRTVALVAALGATMALGTLLGFAYGVLAPFLVADVGLSSLQVGALPSAMYAVGALAAPAAGRATDRFGPASAALLTAPIVAVAFVVLALANGYVVLLVSAAIGGVALAIANPATNGVVAARLSGPTQGWAMGWKQAGVSASAVIAGAVLPAVAEAEGWPTAAVTGAIIAVVVGATFGSVLVHDRGVVMATDASEDRPVTRATRRSVRDLSAFAALLGASNGAVAAYLVLFATEELGVAPAVAGGLTAVLGATAVISRVTWARLGARADIAPPLLRGLARAAVVAVLALPLSGAVGAWMLWPAAVALGASAVSWQGLVMLVAVRRVDPASAGRASAIVVRAFYTGYVIGPLAFGGLLDVTDERYVVAWTVTAAVALVGSLTVRGGRPAGALV
ncbi:MAG: MFS transporter [Actinobacteria bacterium]|nr:MFS transporter [Actinomycetota bacterium]